MAYESPEMLTREKAEQIISRRFKVSKWFTRVMLATGLGCGLGLGSLPANSDITDSAMFGVMTAAALAAPLERSRANKSAENVILDYAVARDVSDTGYWITKVKIEDGILNEQYQFDYRAANRMNNLGTALNGIAIFIGGIGTSLLIREVPVHEAVRSMEANTHTLGGVFTAVSTVIIMLDTLDVNKQAQAYAQRLKNIEGGMTLEM